jgi:Spy/CpxP family protein refolding chaperone
VKSLRSFILPVAIGVALIAPVAVFAQQEGQAPASGTYSQDQRGGHHGFMAMLRGVNLSDSQKSQIRQIMQQFRQAHPQGSITDPQARRQARQQLRQQVMNVLTPQQRAQVQQNMQQMRQRFQQEHDGDQTQSTPQP